MKNNNKKKSIVLVAKAIGGMAFLAIFVMNIMTFVQKDVSTGDLAFVSVNAIAQGEGGGGGDGGGLGCYKTYTLKCSSGPLVDFGERLVCIFNGSYGAPYNCTYTLCGDVNKEYYRRCVNGNDL